MHTRALFFSIFLLAVEGCAFTSSIRMNVPNVDPSGAKEGQEVIRLSGIDVNVYPHNGVQLWQLTQVVIIPVWLSTEDKPLYKGEVFKVRVALLPKADGFSFRPKDVSLEIGDVARIQPSGYNGPFPYDSTKSSEWGRKMANDRWVVCGSHPGRDTPPKTPADVVVLSDIGLWNCFELDFDTKPPDPSQLRGILVEGIMKDGQQISSLRIPFKEIRYLHADSVP